MAIERYEGDGYGSNFHRARHGQGAINAIVEGLSHFPESFSVPRVETPLLPEEKIGYRIYHKMGGAALNGAIEFGQA